MFVFKTGFMSNRCALEFMRLFDLRVGKIRVALRNGMRRKAIYCSELTGAEVAECYEIAMEIQNEENLHITAM